MTEDMLREKSRKQIVIIILVGIIVLIADLVIAGSSNTLELVQSENSLYMVRPAAGQDPGHVTLRAEVKGQDFDKSFDLQVDSIGSDDGSGSSGNGSRGSGGDSHGDMSESELVAYEIRSAVNSINDDITDKRIYLPGKLSTGDEVHWTVERSANTGLIIITIVLLTIFIYRNRFMPLRKQTAAEQDSIARQLPEFVNRLVLLLNAGLVLNSAFEKAASGNADADFFFAQMKEIRDRVRQTNGSMNREFLAFAKSRRGAAGEASRQLMRISNIISDNISKGVELTDKLQRESEVLWLARKRSCEERGRLAETKLTLPLTLFLLVLIVITVSPALLEL